MKLAQRIRRALIGRPTRIKFGSRSMYQTINEHGESVMVMEIICDDNSHELFGHWETDNLKKDVRIALQVVVDEFMKKHGR